MSLYRQEKVAGIFLVTFFLGCVSHPGYTASCSAVVAEFAVDVPLADPITPPPPPSSSSLPKLVTAGTSSSAPNLSATVAIEKSNKDADSNGYVHVGDLYCGIKTANTTSVSIGSFASKCLLYDGLKAGNDSPVVLSSITVSSLSGGAKTTTHHFFKVRNPSYYTLYGCTNTGSSPPKEIKISDNCGTRTFLAYGIPDVRVQSAVIQGGGVSFPQGSTIIVVSDLANDGDNFVAGTNRKMTVSAELSGCVPTRVADVVEMSDDILSSGASGKTKTFSVTIPLTATPGTCTVTIVADPKDELLQSPNKEENRGNNRKSVTFSVFDPTPSEDPNTPVPCPTITASNWNEWSGSGYAPPFDDLDGNALRITPYCKRDNPYFLSVKFGKSGDPNVRTYQTAYVWKGTPTPEPVTLNCDDDPNGAPNANGYCEGSASFEMEAQWINTNPTAGPIPIDAYIVYHLGSNVFRYPTPNTYARQGARMP